MSDAAHREPVDESEIAALVREAGGYVGASPELRPRVIEAAREATALRRRLHRLMGAAALALMLTGGLAAIEQRWQTLAPPQAMTSDQLHRLAGHRAVAVGVGFDWALADVVADWRNRLPIAADARGAIFRTPTEDGTTP